MKQILISAILMFALLAASTGTAFAQEASEMTGTVQSIQLETDAATGETTVLVTLLDSAGETQTVRLSLETAEALGLITIDPVTGEPVVVEEAVGMEITLAADDVIADETEGSDEEREHPVGSALADFFNSVFGVEYDTIMGYHDSGFGFGVIAQALWLTKQVDGDTSTFEALLEAKQSGDYSNITLADGSTPDNWGDVVKSLKQGDNLGSVMSGRANNGEETPGNGNGPGNNPGNGNGPGNNNGNGPGNNPGNGNGPGNGNDDKGKGKDNKDKGKGKDK